MAPQHTLSLSRPATKKWVSKENAMETKGEGSGKGHDSHERRQKCTLHGEVSWDGGDEGNSAGAAALPDDGVCGGSKQEVPT